MLGTEAVVCQTLTALVAMKVCERGDESVARASCGLWLQSFSSLLNFFRPFANFLASFSEPTGTISADSNAFREDMFTVFSAWFAVLRS